MAQIQECYKASMGYPTRQLGKPYISCWEPQLGHGENMTQVGKRIFTK